MGFSFYLFSILGEFATRNIVSENKNCFLVASFGWHMCAHVFSLSNRRTIQKIEPNDILDNDAQIENLG